MKLKYINIRFITAVCLLVSMVVTSCSEILDEEPLVQPSTDQFYKSETDALAALTGAYAQLKDGVGYYRQQFLSNVFAASDQGTSSWKHGNFRKGTITSTDANLTNPWIEMYRGIREANNVIFRVPDIEMDEELKKRVLGEAKFLRALHYFNLVRCFGEVPLRTEPVKPGEEGLPVSSIEDIYAVIIDDLKFASENCWAFGEVRGSYTNDVGRATSGAAHALLAKVYLRIASAKRSASAGAEGNAPYLAFTESSETYYQLAKEECDAVINGGSYQLTSGLAEWQDIFSPSNGNNPEMIFEIQGSSLTEQGTALSNLYCPRGAGLSGGGWGGTNKLLPKFINLHINKNDNRYQQSIVREYQDASKTYVLNAGSIGYVRTITATGASNGNLNLIYTGKYIDSNATTEYTSEQNWHVIRLADVYLMRAEALAELNQNPALAEEDINVLRSRVEEDALVLSGMSMDEFRKALLRERGVELYMEGHRFFDLTRFGVYDEYCKRVFNNTIGARQADDYTWPIPLTETSANPNID